MYEPRSNQAKIFRNFCQILKTSSQLSQIDHWLIPGLDEDEGASEPVQARISGEITLESGSSGWFSEDSHVFEANIVVTIRLPGRQGLQAIDLGEDVVKAVFPNDDSEARDTALRLKGGAGPMTIVVARYPASFEYNDDERVTSSTTIFKLEIVNQTIGEY